MNDKMEAMLLQLLIGQSSILAALSNDKDATEDLKAILKKNATINLVLVDAIRAENQEEEENDG